MTYVVTKINPITDDGEVVWRIRQGPLEAFIKGYRGPLTYITQHEGAEVAHALRAAFQAGRESVKQAVFEFLEEL